MKHPEMKREAWCMERITMPESATFVLRFECERPSQKDYEGALSYIKWKIEWMASNPQQDHVK